MNYGEIEKRVMAFAAIPGTLQWLELIVSRIKYKPNFRIFVGHDYQYDGNPEKLFVVRIAAQVPDANNPGATIRVMQQEMLPSYLRDEREVVRWIGDVIARLEMHEFREFFKYDGDCVEEPHPELKKGSHDPR